MKRISVLWGVVLADDVRVLERVRGVTLLEIAASKFRGEPHVKRVVVGTANPQVAAAARRLNLTVPNQQTIPPYGALDSRGLAFHVADTLVLENTRRIRRWGVPDAIVGIDPLYPFSSYATVHNVCKGLNARWASSVVLDVMPGLVMPLPCVFGHRYAPNGCRPYEDLEKWSKWSRSEWNVSLVRASGMVESIQVSSPDATQLVNRISKGRAFHFSVQLDYSMCYAPQPHNSWAAFVPVDADFRYDAATDRRQRRPDKSFVAPPNVLPMRRPNFGAAVLRPASGSLKPVG